MASGKKITEIGLLQAAQEIAFNALEDTFNDLYVRIVRGLFPLQDF